MGTEDKGIIEFLRLGIVPPEAQKPPLEGEVEKNHGLGPDELDEEILEAILSERQRQIDKWGEQRHPDGTGEDYYKAMQALAKEVYDKTDNPDWASILLEEVYEALSEEDPEKLTNELLQVTAVAVAWLKDLKTREDVV